VGWVGLALDWIIPAANDLLRLRKPVIFFVNNGVNYLRGLDRLQRAWKDLLGRLWVVRRCWHQRGHHGQVHCK
jgi:hypothetical protein